MGTRFNLLLGIVAGLPALSIDLSAPTLALLPVALDTSVFVAGLSLSLFVLGFGFGQFAGGRSSDRLGRRPVLITALLIYTFGGLCCLLATSGGALATARLVQGIGAGGCAVQAYAIIQDLFRGEVARRKQAYVSVVLSTTPMLAPVLGALIVMCCGWRAVHGALVVAGLILMAVVFYVVPESRPPRAHTYGGVGLADSVAMLHDPAFRCITVVNALSYAAIFAYIAGAPVIVMNQFGLSSIVYSSVFACTAAALSLGAFTSARLGDRIDGRQLALSALLIQAVAHLLLIVLAVAPPTGAEWLLLPLLVVSCFARGIIAPNLVHAAISGHREQAGLASALVGLAQLILAAAASALLARVLDEYGIVALACLMAVLTTVAVAFWILSDLSGRLAERT